MVDQLTSSLNIIDLSGQTKAILGEERIWQEYHFEPHLKKSTEKTLFQQQMRKFRNL